MGTFNTDKIFPMHALPNKFVKYFFSFLFLIFSFLIKFYILVTLFNHCFCAPILLSSQSCTKNVSNSLISSMFQTKSQSCHCANNPNKFSLKIFKQNWLCPHKISTITSSFIGGFDSNPFHSCLRPPHVHVSPPFASKSYPNPGSNVIVFATAEFATC